MVSAVGIGHREDRGGARDCFRRPIVEALRNFGRTRGRGVARHQDRRNENEPGSEDNMPHPPRRGRAARKSCNCPRRFPFFESHLVCPAANRGLPALWAFCKPQSMMRIGKPRSLRCSAGGVGAGEYSCLSSLQIKLSFRVHLVSFAPSWLNFNSRKMPHFSLWEKVFC